MNYHITTCHIRGKVEIKTFLDLTFTATTSTLFWQVVCKRFLHFTQAIYADTNAEKKNTARVLTNSINR